MTTRYPSSHAFTSVYFLSIYSFFIAKTRQIKVGRWPLCPVLQQQAMLFTPLSNGEGKAVRWRGAGEGLLMVIYLEVQGAGGRGTETTVLLGGCIRLVKLLMQCEVF